MGEHEVGWDWFALQLDDGRDVMLYRIRRRDGSISPFRAGTVVEASGDARHLGADDFAIEVHDHWLSPATGVRYPARWRISIPSVELELDVTPLVADQELDLAVRYWEGAVRTAGSRSRALQACSG